MTSQEAPPRLETGRDDDGDGGITQPRLGAAGWARWAWRRLTSMRTALLLLLLLAVAAIPGSVFPQRRVDPGAVDAYLAEHTTSGPWLDRLGAFDVYGSPWFSAVYLLLFISLVGCVVPRSRLHLRALRAAPPRTPRRLERMPAFREARTTAAADEVADAARRVLRRRRYRVVRHDDGSIAAERGYLAETGNLVFHLALLGLLVSIAAGAFLGYSGQALLIEGRTWANTVPQYDSYTPGRTVTAADLPPFTLRLDRLEAKFEEGTESTKRGEPRDFRAEVTLRRGVDGEPERRVLRVNDPLTVDGTRMFLVGNGYAPVITVTDGEGNVAFSGPVPFLPRGNNLASVGVVKVADARPEGIGLQANLYPTAVIGVDGLPTSVFPDARNPRLLFVAFTGDLGLDDGPAQSVYVLDTRRMTRVTGEDDELFAPVLAVGQGVDLPGGAGSVRFDGLVRYAAVDVRYDPTKPWVLTTAVLALLGLTLSLFVQRRRVWVRVRPATGAEAGDAGAGRTVVQVAGLARTEDAGLDVEIAEVLERLERQLPATPAQGHEE